ncbi:hypothetical protein LCGC14_0363340 [marine sediment metagenome]|uniref:Uncharacterized protein n=1 Tax=marine sediment metagenome TaxID=412755 RepID=A0A0F9WFN7_9ZZZZ
MSDYLITGLSDSMGYIVEDLMQFFANLTNGWVVMLLFLTVGFIIFIYFRFFSDIVSFRFFEQA